MKVCKFCEAKFETGKALGGHVTRCKLNPKYLELHKQIHEKLKNRKYSESAKLEISKRQKKYLNEHPEMVPYRRYQFVKGPSYPEIYFKRVLENNKISYIENYSVKRYSLDFALVDKKIDLEIDGELHYSNKRTMRIDAERKTVLESLGWKIIRVRWSSYTKLNEKDRLCFIRELIQALEVLTR